MTYFFKNDKGEETKKSTSEIFKVGSNFPNTKVITFDGKKDAFDLSLHYSHPDSLLKGLPQYIAHYTIAEGKPKHDKYSFILRVTNNIHNVAQLESAELQEEWEEEVKIPVKKHTPAPAAPPKQEEAKKEGEAAAEGEKKEGGEEKPAEQPKQEEAKQEYET